jgi:hypothetical protein
LHCWRGATFFTRQSQQAPGKSRSTGVCSPGLSATGRVKQALCPFPVRTLNQPVFRRPRLAGGHAVFCEFSPFYSQGVRLRYFAQNSRQFLGLALSPGFVQKDHTQLAWSRTLLVGFVPLCIVEDGLGEKENFPGQVLFVMI